MNDTTYTTDDLGIASMLVAKGVPYTGLKPTESWKAEMVFDTSSEADRKMVEEALRQWRSGTVEGLYLPFWRASRDLKHEVKQFTDARRR
jgi:hypothetical protein